MFQGSNTNKLDLAVELDTERGRELFLDLVAVSDVVIDNFSPRVLEQLDLDQDVAPGAQPGRDRAARARATASTARGASDSRTRRPSRRSRASRGPPGSPTVDPNRRRASPTRSAARTRRSRCCSRSSTGAAPAAACSSSARWSARRSTSPRSRWSSTRPTVGCSSASATARRPACRRACTAPPTSTPTARRTGGWRSRSRTTTSGDAFAALLGSTPSRGDEDALDARIARVVRDACDRRDRAHALGRGHPVRTGGARARARPTAAGRRPRTVRAGRAPGHRCRRLHRRAVPVHPRPASAPPHALAAARRAQPRRAHPHPRPERRRRRPASRPTA